jgi:hypothetical protein
MKFDYKKFGPGVIRPIIPIKVLYNGQIVSYNVLVDSGADMCLFDSQIGELDEAATRQFCRAPSSV